MLNIGFLSLDILILLIAFGVLVFLSYKAGKKTLTALILASYPSVLIFQYFPYVSFEPGKPEAVFFVFIYVFIYIVLNRNISNKKVYSPFRKVIDYGLLSLSYIALVISISSNVVPSLQNLYAFSGYIPNLINQTSFGVILILPTLILLLTNKSDQQ